MLRWFRKFFQEEDSLGISGESLPAFRQRLAESAAWCSQRGLADMWSTELKPSKTRGEKDYSWVTTEIVEEVCSRRGKLLEGTVLTHYPTGRLLRYAPDENVADGASEMSSKGFFDIVDTPPWDTWVWFTGKYLVCWVPPQLMRYANDGIDINCVACIEWLPEGWQEK